MGSHIRSMFWVLPSVQFLINDRVRVTFGENFNNNGPILSNAPNVKKQVMDTLNDTMLFKDLMTFQSDIQVYNLIL